jgi:phospholipase/carboxylesterase
LETEILQIEGWTVRARVPEAPSDHPILLMLHGWLGNEDVMWVFDQKIPDDFAVYSPRAPHPAPGGGFSWVKNRASGFSAFADFTPSCDALSTLIDSLEARFAGDFSRIHVMGFSQGAALAFSWAALAPQRVRSLAALAGFLPDGAAERLIDGIWALLPVFITHGSRDKIVPIERMRAGALVIEAAGTDLTVCEDDVGHKLSARCLRALGEFYEGMAGIRP